MSDCMKKITGFMYAVEDFSAMRKNFCHLKPIDGSGGHYAKCNKAEKDKTILCFPYMWNLQNVEIIHRSMIGGHQVLGCKGNRKTLVNMY